MTIGAAPAVEGMDPTEAAATTFTAEAMRTIVGATTSGVMSAIVDDP